ncbi:MAG: tRNA glutamyl-Q(34) synthetase GluQRS, partial [Muribaculaceae bacterium]|nr:tRNA glutamyl-Q(34) synthetase GluQRS [Muribaculaceae bacterium]
YAKKIEEDLLWLGLEWDEGGLDDKGANGPYSQSRRSEIYYQYLAKLSGHTYPCFCKRADIMATQAPHQSDGRIIYSGKCRPDSFPAPEATSPHSTRIVVPDRDIHFTDRMYGEQCVNLTQECGDFVVRRADGAFGYQLAVVIDDALMGITEVVRGSDLLLSAAQQIYIYELLGFAAPEFAHVPLLFSPESDRRLSKRDASLSMEALRKNYSAEELIGMLANIAGLRSTPKPVSANELLEDFDFSLIHRAEHLRAPYV